MNIGIDFSINSPGICIFDGTEYRFHGFYNESGKNFEKKSPKDFDTHLELALLKDVSIHKFSRRKKHDDYTVDQWQKIEDASTLADMIRELLLEQTEGELPHSTIAIEGYSYGSKGNSFIDLIAFNSTLRNVLYRTLDGGKILVKSPSAVKTVAGKGNLAKDKMIEAFIENKLGDPALEKSEFWIWCCKHRERILSSIPKPIDDLVDSYWVCRSGLA
jgi:hypothetical protein